MRKSFWASWEILVHTAGGWTASLSLSLSNPNPLCANCYYLTLNDWIHNQRWFDKRKKKKKSLSVPVINSQTHTRTHTHTLTVSFLQVHRAAGGGAPRPVFCTQAATRRSDTPCHPLSYFLRINDEKSLELNATFAGKSHISTDRGDKTEGGFTWGR